MFRLRQNEVAIVVAGLLLITAIAGCKKASTESSAQTGVSGFGPNAGGSGDTSPDPADAALRGPFAAGRKVFNANGCAKCHTVGKANASAMAGGPPGGQGPGSFGPGGRGGMQKGPDLGKVGADPMHSPQWLAEHVRNPKTHKPQSRMPSYAGKIKEEDLLALADYLASLK
ncbi:MAG: c-type cytochrome [Gemmataceae bacterium]